MKINRYASLLIFSCLSSCCHISAQPSGSKEISHEKQVWLDFFENIRIQEKWWIQAEVTERFYVDPRNQFLAGARVYGLYNVGEGWHIGPGFSIWFPKNGEVHTHELRPAQQFFYRQKMEKRKRIGFTHRFKIEERFVRNVTNGELADGYTFSIRFRYRFAVEYTLAKLGKKEYPIKLLVNDEVFLQAGKKVIFNVFDQNRFYAGISATFAKGTSVTIGYLNYFRQLSSGNKYDNFHTFRLFFTHDLAIGKKKG
ncbi:MAG: DUF2490 domain-containing protein [Chitinophagales bacterium]|nr:DUF2490 domain-containing protein [Chitinophagales bacterium]